MLYYPMGHGLGSMLITGTTLESRLHRVGFGLIKASIGILALEHISFKRPIIAVCVFLTGLDT